MKYKWLCWLPGILSICLHVCILVHGIWIHFPNQDEIGHLPAGMSHWKFGAFDLYRVNPPLVRTVAGFPAWWCDTGYDWSLYSSDPRMRAEFQIGKDRLYAKGLELHRDFIAPRLLCIPFSIFGCLVLSFWIWKVFGVLAANVACVFWCFSPEILAHAQTVVPDVAATSFGIVASFTLWSYLVKPNVVNSYFVGIGLGLAMLTKLTWLSGMVSFPATVVFCQCFLKMHNREVLWKHYILHFILFSSVSILIVNVGYLFEGSGTRLGTFQFCSQTLSGQSDSSKLGNRFFEGWFADLPVPLPKNYLMGIDFLWHETELKKWSFLLGEMRFGSWSYYYILTTLFKTPLATLIGSIMGFVIILYRQFQKTSSCQASLMICSIGIPALCCFFSVSYQGGFNHHHRYVMSINPLLFALVALLAEQKIVRLAKIRLFSCICLTVFMMGSVLSVSPHYLSFFNCIAGGPSSGWKVLGASNIDWGQDLLMVAEWIKNNPERQPVAFELGYFKSNGELFGLPNRDPVRRKLGQVNSEIETTTPNTSVCYYIVSKRMLHDIPNRAGLAYLQKREVFDEIGFSMAVFKIEDELWDQEAQENAIENWSLSR